MYIGTVGMFRGMEVGITVYQYRRRRLAMRMVRVQRTQVSSGNHSIMEFNGLQFEMDEGCSMNWRRILSQGELDNS